MKLALRLTPLPIKSVDNLGTHPATQLPADLNLCSYIDTWTDYALIFF